MKIFAVIVLLAIAMIASARAHTRFAHDQGGTDPFSQKQINPSYCKSKGGVVCKVFGEARCCKECSNPFALTWCKNGASPIDVWCVAHMYFEFFFFDHVGWAQQQNSNNKRSGLRGIYRNEELPDTCGTLFFTYQYLVRGPTVIFAVEGGVQIHLPLLLMLKCSRWTNKFPYGRCYDLFCVSLKFSSFHDVDDLLDSPSPRSGSLTPAYDRSSSPSNLPVDNDPSNLQMPTTGM